MLMPPMPPVDDGIAMPVLVGDMAIDVEAIVMPSIFIFACWFRAIVN